MIRRIAILGGGASARAYAAELSLRGYEIGLYEAPNYFNNMSNIIEKGGIHVNVSPKVDKMQSGFAFIHSVTNEMIQAINYAEVIMVAVPSHVQLQYADALAPILQDGQAVIFTPTIMGITAYLYQRMRDNNNLAHVLLIEAEYIRHMSTVTKDCDVNINGMKSGLSFAAFPSAHNERAQILVKELFEDWQICSNIFEVALRNTNAIFHVPLMVLNAGQIDRQSSFAFYAQGCTEKVANVVDMVEEERIQIGQALNIDMVPLETVLKQWYGVESGAWYTLGEALRLNKAYESIMAPKTLDHRFLTEDVPYGLAAIESLAKAVHVATPAISSLIVLSNILLNGNLHTKSHTLKTINLADYDAEKLIQLAKHGFGKV